MESTFYTLLQTAYTASQGFEENNTILMISSSLPGHSFLFSFIIFPSCESLMSWYSQSYLLRFSSSPSKNYNLKCLQKPRRHYKYVNWPDVRQ